MGDISRFTSKSYYELLGVAPDATTEEIQIAYRDLERVYSSESDFFRDIIDDPLTPEQKEIFALITKAFETLKNPEHRRGYDDKPRVYGDTPKLPGPHDPSERS